MKLCGPLMVRFTYKTLLYAMEIAVVRACPKYEAGKIYRKMSDVNELPTPQLKSGLGTGRSEPRALIPKQNASIDLFIKDILD